LGGIISHGCRSSGIFAMPDSVKEIICPSKKTRPALGGSLAGVEPLYLVIVPILVLLVRFLPLLPAITVRVSCFVRLAVGIVLPVFVFLFVTLAVFPAVLVIPVVVIRALVLLLVVPVPILLASLIVRSVLIVALLDSPRSQ
jgi:hypothetical protein